MKTLPLVQAPRPVHAESIESLLRDAKPEKHGFRIAFLTPPGDDDSIDAAENFLKFAERGEIILSRESLATLRAVVKNRIWNSHSARFCFQVGESFHSEFFAEELDGYVTCIEAVNLESVREAGSAHGKLLLFPAERNLS